MDMYLVLIFAAVLLADCRSANVNKHMKLFEINNHIETSGVQQKSSNIKYVSIKQRPNDTYTHEPGTTLSLTCVMVGSPAPSVHWFKNDAPVYEFDMESNELIDSSPTSVGEVTSTLLVRRAARRDVFSCVAAAGAKTARATTTVYGIDGSTDLSERTRLFPLAPRIVVSYKVYLDLIGTNVVLPCRVKGHPRPHVTWSDNRGNVIKKNNRMKILRSGELVISSLRWSDMGEFTCQAENMFGTKTASTFVYPAKAG